MEKNSPSDSKSFYRTGEWYSLTIAPNNKRQYIRDGERIGKCRKYMYDKVLAWPQHGIEYWLRPELSEPRKSTFDKNGDPSTIGPRLHWHGMIRFLNNKSILYWLVYGMSYLMIDCVVDIDTISDYDVWVSYCKKQESINNFNPLESGYNLISSSEEEE